MSASGLWVVGTLKEEMIRTFEASTGTRGTEYNVFLIEMRVEWAALHSNPSIHDLASSWSCVVIFRKLICRSLFNLNLNEATEGADFISSESSTDFIDRMGISKFKDGKSLLKKLTVHESGTVKIKSKFVCLPRSVSAGWSRQYALECLSY